MGRRHKLKAEGIRTCQQLDMGPERNPNSPTELASPRNSLEWSYVRMTALETVANLASYPGQGTRLWLAVATWNFTASVVLQVQNQGLTSVSCFPGTFILNLVLGVASSALVCSNI